LRAEYQLKVTPMTRVKPGEFIDTALSSSVFFRSSSLYCTFLCYCPYVLKYVRHYTASFFFPQAANGFFAEVMHL
jgi:hypothetical protein